MQTFWRTLGEAIIWVFWSEFLKHSADFISFLIKEYLRFSGERIQQMLRTLINKFNKSLPDLDVWVLERILIGHILTKNFVKIQDS